VPDFEKLQPVVYIESSIFEKSEGRKREEKYCYIRPQLIPFVSGAWARGEKE
jgi:hypothetical protein